MEPSESAKPAKAASIMIVDNNPNYSSTLRHVFEERGYLIWTCPGPEIAASIMAAIHPTFVLLDLDLHGTDPLQIIDAWREISPETCIVVEMAVPDVHRLRAAMDHGANTFFVKSHSLKPLLKYLEDLQPRPPLPSRRINLAA